MKLLTTKAVTADPKPATMSSLHANEFKMHDDAVTDDK